MVQITLQANTQEELDNEITEYMKSYHPAGYGTMVKKKWEEDGVFKALISRGRTCD